MRRVVEYVEDMQLEKLKPEEAELMFGDSNGSAEDYVCDGSLRGEVEAVFDACHPGFVGADSIELDFLYKGYY